MALVGTAWKIRANALCRLLTLLQQLEDLCKQLFVVVSLQINNLVALENDEHGPGRVKRMNVIGSSEERLASFINLMKQDSPFEHILLEDAQIILKSIITHHSEKSLRNKGHINLIIDFNEFLPVIYHLLFVPKLLIKNCQQFIIFILLFSILYPHISLINDGKEIIEIVVHFLV